MKYLIELAELVPFSYSRGISTRYSNSFYDFSVSISRYYQDIYVNSFFPGTARFISSLLLESCAFMCDVNGFESRVDRHQPLLGSVISFLVCFSFLSFCFSSNSVRLVAVQPCMQ